MFEMTLTFDLGVLAVQHDGVMDGTVLTVGQGPGDGPRPPVSKLTVEPSTTNVEVGQNDGGGQRPPPK